MHSYTAPVCVSIYVLLPLHFTKDFEERFRLCVIADIFIYAPPNIIHKIYYLQFDTDELLPLNIPLDIYAAVALLCEPAHTQWL